jgi:hypothetical protein
MDEGPDANKILESMTRSMTLITEVATMQREIMELVSESMARLDRHVEAVSREMAATIRQARGYKHLQTETTEEPHRSRDVETSEEEDDARLVAQANEARAKRVIRPSWGYSRTQRQRR